MVRNQNIAMIHLELLDCLTKISLWLLKEKHISNSIKKIRHKIITALSALFPVLFVS